MKIQAKDSAVKSPRRRRWSYPKTLLALSLLLGATSPAAAEDFTVSSASDISNAMRSAQPGDVLIMSDGVWPDEDIDFAGDGTESNPITLRAESPGGVILNDGSQLSISGNYLVVDGLIFEDGGNNSLRYVIEFRGSDGDARNCRLTNTQIIDYDAPDRTHQYHWLNIYGQDNRVDHCRLQGHDHEGVMLVVWLNDNLQQARHQIDFNEFLDRPLGQDSNGHEAIRVGTSARHTASARVVVEHNLFENCDGEIEIISNKSEDNIYRYNTFRSCAGTLTLRHGGGATVEGNFFLGEGKDRSGGIRVVDSDHVIVNNYIADVDDRADAAISLAAGLINSPANGYQPVVNVDIHNNTIVDVAGAAVVFGWELGDDFSGVEKDQTPRNISLVNNLIRSSRTLFEGQEGSGNEWVDNIAFGASLGISLRSGLQTVNPQITVAADGLWRPTSSSPAIDGGTTLNAVTIDMDGQARVGTYDIGADEFSSASVTITPLNAGDVGPYTDSVVVVVPTPIPTPPVSPVAGTIVDDSFSDGDRTITGNSGSDMELAFYSTSNSSAIEDNVDDGIGAGLIGLVSGTSGRQIHAVFPSQTLAVAGDTITARVTFVTPQVVASNLTQTQFNALSTAVRDGASLSAIPTNGDDLRIGLFSTSTTNGGLDQDIESSSNPATGPGPNTALAISGYAIELDVESAASGNTTDLQLREYLAADASGRLLGTNTGSSTAATDASNGPYVFQPNTEYEVHQTYTLNASGGLEVAIDFLENGTSLGTLNFTDTSPATLEFGTLALGASSEAFGLSNDPGDPSNGIDISNVTITVNEPVACLRGDINLDGEVNLFDIAPFISILTSGGFQKEADVDEDGMVNLFDISPFIVLLTAG